MGGKRWEGNLSPRRRTNAVPYTLVHKATLVSSRTKADADASKGTERGCIVSFIIVGGSLVKSICSPALGKSACLSECCRWEQRCTRVTAVLLNVGFKMMRSPPFFYKNIVLILKISHFCMSSFFFSFSFFFLSLLFIETLQREGMSRNTCPNRLRGLPSLKKESLAMRSLQHSSASTPRS